MTAAVPALPSLARAAELRGLSAPALLAKHARRTPARVAFRAKKHGLYRERTWRDYAVRVARVAEVFERLGVQHGDRVAIIGEVCEEWMIADQAAQALGAITYGIYPTAAPAEIEYQLVDGGARLVVCEDQEYVDKILPLAASGRLVALERIVVIDTSAMFGYAHPLLASLAMLEAEVRDTEPELLERLDARVSGVRATDPAFIVYTSGTTGHPKGALVVHGKHLAAAYTFVMRYPLLAAKAHRAVVYLPLCHILGRDLAITLPLMSGIVPHFGEDPEDLPATLFEVAPTVLFAVPRYLQKFASQVLVGIAASSPAKRSVYARALEIGRAFLKRRWADPSVGESIAYRFARAVAFRPLLNKLGMDRLEIVLTGGAPLAPETAALWQIWGVNVVDIYGQTETAGAIISGQRADFPRPGSVGTVAQGWEIRFGEGNEILVRGPDLFEGYWNRPDATRETIDAEGWLHTGDVGEVIDGQLRLVDRARDFLVTAGGKTVSPAYIENIARASPYIGEIIVFGHARKYLTALVEIDFDTVSDWARQQNIAYTGFTSLAANPRVIGLVAAEIESTNAQLARVETIKQFRILPKALDPEEEGEPVTPTRKVKRKLMYERFQALVESMYDDAEDRRLAAAAGDVLASAKQ